MGRFYWDVEKNVKLIAERGVSFEEVLLAIENGKLLGDLEHPNREKYRNQRLFIVELRGYAYLVPFVEEAGGVFLKTIIPSRKYTKKYLGGENETPET